MPGRSVATLALALALTACTSEPQASDSPPSPSPKAKAGSVVGSTSKDSPVHGTFKVNGRKLFITCAGTGEPTMVLEVGEGADRQSIKPIRDAYKSKLMVCSYDRANKGRSGKAPKPRGGKAMVSDLHGLLEAAEVPGPYLLVGQSAGGLLVQDYAATHPEDVAGVVSMNPVPPWTPWFNVALKQATAKERKAETDYFGGENAEFLDYRAISKDVAEQPVPKDIPFHLLMSTVAQCEGGTSLCARTYPAYEKILKRVARHWKRGKFSQVKAPHEIYLSDMKAVRRAIDDVLSRVKGS